MIARFSVKKPYTVVVAVVLVLILGSVSFTKMNTDLLPSMDLPYAIVYGYGDQYRECEFSLPGECVDGDPGVRGNGQYGFCHDRDA